MTGASAKPRRIIAVIPAAGSGDRFGSRKQFECIHCKPILVWTVENMIKTFGISNFIILMPCEQDVMKYNCILSSLNHLHENLSVKCAVGDVSSRHGSIGRSLSLLPAVDTDLDDVIVVHDAARPYISKRDTFEKLLAKLDAGATSAGCFKKLTPTVLKLSEDGSGFDSALVPRSSYVASETPQLFTRHVFELMYESATDEDISNGTECLHLAMVHASSRPALVEIEESECFKITYPHDLDRFSSLCEDAAN